MDTEEIQNRLVNLSRPKFRNVVAMILREVFQFPALNVDAKGDGGNDWYVYSQGAQKIHLAVQDTIQQQKWQEKALDDARNAKANHDANRYIFCTNRPHEQIKVTSLENRISNETGMSATVLEARRLAELIFQGGLREHFLQAIGETAAPRRPAMPEIALCVYTNLSADRTSHRSQIYGDTLLVVCRENGPMDRRSLVDGALKFLGSAPGQRQLVDRKVDSLLSERRLRRRKGDQKLILSTETEEQLGQTERLYLSDWQSLTGAQTSLLAEYGGSWTDAQAEQATILLARLFIQEQLAGLESAGASILTGQWLDKRADPKQQLRDLLQSCGVPLAKIGELIGKLVNQARHREVITKLTRTAVFAALEGQDPLQSAHALGASGWDEVTMLLDASVAIPFLCASRTECVEDYVYALSKEAVEGLREFGATARIAPGHLEECVAHLLRAFYYEPLGDDKDFQAALRHSENAFVAYYYALRHEQRRAPRSLHQFLQIFCSDAPRLIRRPDGFNALVRLAMPDVQDGFADYDVRLTQLSRPTRERLEALEKAHDWAMLAERRTKLPILRRHDLLALAHVEERALSNRESWIVLTWDKAIMRLAKHHLKSAWIVSPEITMDFLQPCRRLSETQWCTLAHRLARISDPLDSLTARIIDQVAHSKHGQLQDWEFKEQLREFREQALSRQPVGEEAKYHTWIETEASTFLSEHRIPIVGDNRRKS